MPRTLAVIVGISRYQGRLFDSLPGAAADARRIADSLADWGVRPENIRLLTNEGATRSAILEALRVWALKSGAADVHLLFFFAGHGARVQDPASPAVSVLLPFDAERADRAGTGIQLSDVVGAIGRLQATQAFLFLDACSLRLDHVDNVLPLTDLPDADLLTAPASNCLFCMVAAGLQLAVEDVATRTGFFTRSVLNQLARLRHSRSTCAELALAVGHELEQAALPKPEFYLIGDCDCWPLPNEDEHEERNDSMHDDVVRTDGIAVVRDAIAIHQSRPVWLRGPSGAGKTTLVKQLTCRSGDCAYFSIPRSVTCRTADLMSELVAEVADQLPGIYTDGRPNSGDFGLFVERLSDGLAGGLLTLDHVERLPSELVHALACELSDVTFDVLYVSRTAPPAGIDVCVLECPKLTESDAGKFVAAFGSGTDFSAQLLLSASNFNPLSLRDLLVNSEMTAQSVFASDYTKDAIAAVVECGGYVDEVLFRNVTGVDTVELANLEEKGFIRFADDRFLPHDELIEVASKLGRSSDPHVALDYWSRQVAETPQHMWACRMLVQSFLNSDAPSDCDDSLLTAFQSLVRSREWPLIERAADKLSSTSTRVSSAALYAAEQLVRVARYDIAERITSEQSKHDMSAADRYKVSLIQSERAWWYGHYEESISKALEVIGAGINPVFVSQARVNAGIAFFFLGKWEQAIRYLTLAEFGDSVDPRVKAWSHLILGTISGLRGVDVSKGCHLLQSSIRLLSAIGDDIGLAIAWNNLGEINWKIGEYRSALVQLTSAYDLALAGHNPTLQIEATRNLLQVRLRLNGPFSRELEALLARIHALLTDTTNPGEAMQIWNTLATVAAYRLDKESMQESIKRVSSLTQGNAEYHIYTLANMALLSALEHNIDQAIQLLIQSNQLAAQGNNQLAIRQIQDDLTFLSSEFDPDTFRMLSLAISQ